MNSTWYVSFEVPKALKRLGRRIPRATETFQSESEAKEFARVKYAAGLKINAGTINPHVPKRAIAWTDVHRWLGDMPEQEEELAGNTRPTELALSPAAGACGNHGPIVGAIVAPHIAVPEPAEIAVRIAIFRLQDD
jgi:hypothetical protein